MIIETDKIESENYEEFVKKVAVLVEEARGQSKMDRVSLLESRINQPVLGNFDFPKTCGICLRHINEKHEPIVLVERYQINGKPVVSVSSFHYGCPYIGV
jgi:hypothetical protein